MLCCVCACVMVDEMNPSTTTLVLLPYAPTCVPACVPAGRPAVGMPRLVSEHSAVTGSGSVNLSEAEPTI